MLVALFAITSTVSAQNYMIVDSEKVFKSVAAYNNAITEVDNLATKYQEQVDAKYKAIETLYNNYMAQRNSLSASVRQTRENDILQKEREAKEFQESKFATDGEIMKRRLELISPIQEMVFDAIDAYAKNNGFDLVLDAASNATILYKSDRIDKTQSIINELKK